MTSLDNFFAVLLRLVVMVCVYYILFQKFHRQYQKSKDSGHENAYFKGFTVFFFIMTVFHVLYGTYELYLRAVPNPLDIKARFSWFQDPGGWVSTLVNNQMRPLYLTIYFVMSLVMAAQIYPLEQANNWKKNPIAKSIVVFASSLWLLFIPAIGNSIFAVIPVLLGFTGIGIGLLLNIFINIKLYAKTVGEIRNRALYGAVAFILFTLGILWSIELGFGEMISDSLSNRWDVVIGSLIQILAAFFYLKGYGNIQILSEEQGESKAPEKNSFVENLKGNFTRYDLLDWMVIGGVLGFGFLALAWMVYPQENAYSITKDTISFLGSMDPNNNPAGWWLFTISFTIFGLMLIPVAIYRHRRLKYAGNGKMIKGIEFLSFLFYIIAALGVVVIAFVPDNQGQDFYADVSTGKLHNKIALVAFGGFGLALLLEFVVLMVDAFSTKHFNKKYWVPSYILFLTVAGLTAYTQIKWEMICESECWPGDGIYSFPLWEWIVFFTLFLVLYVIVLSLPTKIKTLKED